MSRPRSSCRTDPERSRSTPRRYQAATGEAPRRGQIMSAPDAIPITFFTDYAARSKHEEVLAPAELARKIEQMAAAEKARLPRLKLARFGTVRSDKNSLRHDPNVLAITGIEADYDGERVSFDEAVEIA